MKVFVFLGPTMPVAVAREILPEATYLPPAAQSDILSLVDQEHPDAILIVDGVFTQALSVWHKEILYALEQGTAVYGSSSMGALRVAETAPFGAVGIGSIFTAYVEGELTDDDEVAVVHTTAEEGYRSLSDAMVNIRATLAAARAEGVVDGGTHDRLVALAKARFYPERSYAQLFKDAADAGIDTTTVDSLRDFVRSSAVDQKRDDAVALLTHVRDHGVTPPPPHRVTRSHLFEALYHRDRRVDRGGVQVPLCDISSYAALHLPDADAVNEHALDAALVDVLAELLHVEAEPGDVAAERDRFRQERRLRADEDLARWRDDNDLTERELDDLLARRAVRRRMRDWYISRKYLERTTQEVLDELRLRGRYPAVADAAALQQEVLGAAHPDFEYRGDDADLMQLLRDHARATPWRPTAPLDVWAFEHGFKDVSDVRYELVRARLARRATDAAVSSLFDAPAAAADG